MCHRYARAVYFGLDPACKDGFAHSSAWNLYIVGARAQTLAVDQDLDLLAETSVMPMRAPRQFGPDQAAFECVRWWVSWLRLEDQSPNDPIIMTRRIPTNQVYELEYAADMRWWGTAKVLSLSRWTTLRAKALEELSLEYFGQVSDCDPTDVRLSIPQHELLNRDGGFGVPVQKLTLQQRPKHANFGSCNECERDRARWQQFRTSASRGTLGDVEAMKRDIFMHVQEVKKERDVAMEMHQRAATSRRLSYEYDDKCGSSFLHLPSPKGRPTAATEGERQSVYIHMFSHALTPPPHTHTAPAGRWQYRFGLHGNLYPGGLMRFSMVPRCLKTGVNFGLSAYLSAAVRAAERGILGEETVRQTDSGPDCDAKETHAFNVEFVSRGAVNKLTWIRLKPKHSHNYADRCNSMVKEVIWPQHGTGGGCMAPWDMEPIVQKAMASQSGPVELGWHWNNFDFKERYAAHLNKDFHFYDDVYG